MIARTGRIIALGATLLLVGGCLGPAPSTPPSATATPVASPVTTPAPSPSAVAPAAVDAAAWYPVSIFPDTPELGPATMTAVTPTWFGFLAVGWTPRGGTSWWSRDGHDWTAALFQGPPLRNAMLTGVAASATRIVAIGSTQAMDGETRGQIWTSADGLAWTPTLNVPSGSVATVTSIVHTATAFIVVGTIDAGDEGRAVVWSSPDGSTWTEAAALYGAPSQVVDGPAGLLVLDQVSDDVSGPDVSGALIGSAGVATHTEFPSDTQRIAGGPDAYWAFTLHVSATGSDGSVFRSEDGTSWTRTSASPTTSRIAAVVVQADGSLVITTHDGEPAVTDAVLRSSDGSHWDPVTWPSPLEPGSDITALAIGQDHLVGVGSIGQRRAAAWIGQPTAADSPGPLARDPAPTGCPSRETWSASPTAVLDAVLRLDDPERAHCLGTTTIRVAGFLAVPDGLGGYCDAVAMPEWLTGGCSSYPSGWLEDVAVPFGRADTLYLFDRPTLPRTLKGNRWVVATGHFNDPRSSTCRLIGPGPGPGNLAEPAAVTVAACRSHFVVTRIAGFAAPPPDPIDPAASLGLPGEDLLAPTFRGWDNMALPTGTTFGFREVLPPGGARVVVTVFHLVDPANAATVESTVIGDVGPATSSAVHGVTVTRSADGAELVFAVGARVYQLQVEGLASGATSPEAISLGQVLEALIRAALAS